MPTIRVCEELYREINKLREVKINQLLKVGVKRGEIDGLSYPGISWETCSREWFKRIRKQV